LSEEQLGSSGAATGHKGDLGKELGRVLAADAADGGLVGASSIQAADSSAPLAVPSEGTRPLCESGTGAPAPVPGPARATRRTRATARGRPATTGIMRVVAR
jgi:hypothetical protein